MKCRCCNFEFPQDEGKCPRCSFPVIYLPDDSDQRAQKQIEETVGQYRRNHYEAIRISVTQYTWKKVEDRIELDKKKQIFLCTAAELMEKEEIILGQLFARTPSAKTIDLEYSVGSVSGKTVMTAPTDVSFWQVGARIEDGLRFRFLLKSDSQCNISEPIALA